MTQLCAYLSYNGNCAEAMAFYARVLDAKVEALITYAQMPDGDPVPPEHADRIMHAYLVHPDFALMAGDTPPGMAYQGITGAMMAITFDEPAEAQRVFTALSEGGTVTILGNPGNAYKRKNCRITDFELPAPGACGQQVTRVPSTIASGVPCWRRYNRILECKVGRSTALLSGK